MRLFFTIFAVINFYFGISDIANKDVVTMTYLSFISGLFCLTMLFYATGKSHD